jgi:hypothetical protein
MKQVLWVSRHQMTEAQQTDLERIMGGAVHLLPWRDTVQDVSCLQPMLQEADAIAVVLPLEMLAQLIPMAQGKPVLQAVSARVPTGRTLTLPDGRQEQEFAFVHRCWKQIMRVEIETKQL